MQDAKAVSIRDRSEEEVDRRQSVVPYVGQLALCINCATFDPFVYGDKGESEQLLNQLVMVVGTPCRVTGLKQEWQASRNTPIFKRNRYFLCASIGKRSVAQPCPSGIVQ